MTKRLAFSIALLSCICIAAPAQNDLDRDWADFGRYGEANAEVAESPLAVLMGDSITDGWFSKDGSFFEDGTFIGRGISGQVTSQMLVRFRRDVIDLHPKYVVILAGINDIALNQGRISKENTLGNIISMAEIARANGIKPVFCSLFKTDAIPWRSEAGNPTEDVLWINEGLKAYAASHRIIYIDYAASLIPEGAVKMPENYSKDGVHPTVEAYKVMEDLLMDALRIKRK
ncbi:MAG: GDSL-type esterase/lipase family protein [Bacteroidales bacterium]|nr:GDSL-type esterase/lipase family protein [Bacteroidales bacterium]